jgi:hypothetical protein
LHESTESYDDFDECRAAARMVRHFSAIQFFRHTNLEVLSYGPPWAHYLSGYQDRLLGGPLGLPGLRYTAPEGVELKDYIVVVLG